MVVVNFSGVGKIVEVGTYPVVLTKATEKKTAKGSDMVTLQATIKGSGTEWDGRPLFRNFIFSNDPGADNSGTLFYLQQALLAFDADEDDVAEDGVNVVEFAKTLYGNSAQAEVTHNVDANDPSKIYPNVKFIPADL